MYAVTRRATQTQVNRGEIAVDRATRPGALAFNWSEEVHYA